MGLFEDAVELRREAEQERRIIISFNENGTLKCEIEGVWIGKYIRLIPNIVIRAFRKQKYALIKANKGE